jgi:hypothetical protein
VRRKADGGGKINQTMKCEAGKCKMERIVGDFQLPEWPVLSLLILFLDECGDG